MENSIARLFKMETSSDVATWLSFVVTAVGLGGLLSQASAINDKLDPFHSHRTPTYLGFWYGHQDKLSWWKVRRPPLYGPVLVANLENGFCGKQIIHLTRLPLFAPPGKAGWALILTIFHPDKLHSLRSPSPSIEEAERATEHVQEKTVVETEDRSREARDRRTQWKSLERMQLARYQAHACVSISRTTLITMMALTNARVAFSYSDASGFRAGYASYNGQWYITWPIGQDAVVQFSPHDSHKKSTDVYPPSFTQRTNRCTQMLAGVIVAPSGLQLSFCGRKPAGTYVLEYAVKGFPGAHGSRHLYNMLGGKVYEVDYIFARDQDSTKQVNEDYLTLKVPSKDSSHDDTVFLIPRKEQEAIAQALDCLPWNHLSWSIHRGMRDILLAYSKATMDRFRSQLAALLKRTVAEKQQLLERKGWESSFVRNSMGEMAASAILLGKGNSGDLVRVVTDIMRALVDDWSMDHLDETHFWRLADQDKELDLPGAVALTKVFIVEWSNEFDYQMYHDLPVNLKSA
ncbi:uncharacterized protein J4E78_001192 [Alternaria triticimaculans]|uniref:uncharacterized protein n=1 Tax=Alternaria triticimaculans TaxID=297637 RepID=UPI0020C546DD|nr:uncharacterized protein J4E78_001192 [Alternaria triticimaculans]KAI4672690.1 hypothetical protein J4E78_001192 [Alternaria triticimaculans]